AGFSWANVSSHPPHNTTAHQQTAMICLFIENPLRFECYERPATIQSVVAHRSNTNHNRPTLAAPASKTDDA
ncbi:MAG: hypothetical protein ACK5TO_20150, partial [Planctomycetaceae bacterium]